MEDLFRKVSRIANEWYEGDYTIIKTKEGFKGYFGDDKYTNLHNIKTNKSLKNLLEKMIKNPNDYCIWKINDDAKGLKELYNHMMEETGSNYIGDGMYLNSDGNFYEE